MKAIPEKTETVHEAIGVFDTADALQAAMDDLQENGFMRQELSVLAGEETIEDKLGHIYQRTKEAEDDPEAPRTIFVADETIGEAEGAAIGLPLYLAAATASGIVVASGGTLLSALGAASVAGAAGATLGGLLAQFIAKHHADYIQKQIEHGGLVLWVHLRAPELEGQAKNILARNKARDIHIHEIPLY